MSPPNPFAQYTPVHVLHTVNGGAFWDDFTANLPDVPAHGVAADRASGALYVATDRGVFLTYADLASLGAAQPWTALSGLPATAAADVKLDAQGNQLWAAVDGYGVFATLAPHRLRDPSVVSAADFVARAVAPGSLISILGAGVDSARAGDLSAPVLASRKAAVAPAPGRVFSLETGHQLSGLVANSRAPRSMHSWAVASRSVVATPSPTTT